MNKSWFYITFTVFVFLIFTTFHVAIAATPSQKTALLFSLEDAKLLNHEDDVEWNRRPIVTRGAHRGPLIKLKTPPPENHDRFTIQTSNPLDLLVYFKKTLAPVEMESLKVIAKKGWFEKNLTDEIKPYIIEKSIHASGLKIPQGRFKIVIEISDIQKNTTSTEYRLIVEK